MSQPPPDILSPEWGWMPFRRDALQLVAWGYQLMEGEIRKVHREEDITGLIRLGINRKLDEELPPRFEHYFVANEDPVDDAGVHGKDRPRIDISVESSGCRPRKRYRLEAKRCARRPYSISVYGAGIRSFLSGLYAKDAPEAGLLGLVQSDTPAYWRQQLASMLGTDTSLACHTALVDAEPVPGLGDVSNSTHVRDNGMPILLHHVFIDCLA